MHYFEFNIKDYRADAFQLTLIQHGAYKQLIDQYCLNESPLTLNLEDLFYDLLIRGDDEKKAIVFVLEKFFDKTRMVMFTNDVTLLLKSIRRKVISLVMR
jgi:uncharacterized protein YdaU (DUF1376 family)